MTFSAENVSGREIRPLGLYLFGIIDQPVATFEAILTQRRWLTWAMPLLVVIVAFAVTTIAQILYTLEMAASRWKANWPHYRPVKPRPLGRRWNSRCRCHSCWLLAWDLEQLL